MINTPKGIITARRTTDPDYPGIEILMTTPEGYEESIAVVEYQTEEDQIATYVYVDGQEEYLEKIIHMKGVK